jgi:hypothetical protein
VVTKTREGEWLKYSITVPADGPYTIAAAVANGTSNGTFHLEVDNQDVTGPIQGSTGGYDVWQELTVDDITLAAGEHVLTFVFDETGHILDYLDIRAPVAPITVLQPNGGERLSVGDSLIVTWTCDTAQVNDVFVQMSTNDGESWVDLTVGGSIDTHDLRWGRFAYPLSADLASDAALVRVVEYGGSRNDVSDAAFSVMSNVGVAAGHSTNAPGVLIRRHGATLAVGADGRAGAMEIMLIDMRGRVRAQESVNGTAMVELLPGTYIAVTGRQRGSAVRRHVVPQ